MGNKSNRPGLAFAVTNRPASLCPKMESVLIAKEEFESILNLSIRHLQELHSSRGWAALKRIRDGNPCKIYVSKLDISNALHVRFVGTEQGIKKAESEVKMFLAVS